MDAVSGRSAIEKFIDSGVGHSTLGLVYGRRRIGKSTLLSRISGERGGFYWEATRAEKAVHLSRLWQAIGEHLGSGPLLFESWEQALSQLLHLGSDEATLVVLDEFGYVIEADPSVDSVLAGLLGPAARDRVGRKARLINCGSAIAMMGTLTAGEAPLRGRAGLEFVMQVFDYRTAAHQFGLQHDPELAARVFAVIGGVIGYATDMVDHDLPRDSEDFDRWVASRILSPAATLHHEATTLLAEDPALTGSSIALYHSILGAIANGAVTAGSIANKLRRSVPNIDPSLKRLISAGFVHRREDPIRAQRPTYALADSFLQFHYAILEPHRTLLRERDPREIWRQRLVNTFDSRVRGPVFEEQARTWTRKYAAPETLGGFPDFVGPSTVNHSGKEYELDLVVAANGDGEPPADRKILAIGEAKAGETISKTHLTNLERVRALLGPRAAQSRLLLFGKAFDEDFRQAASGRPDVELIDLERLYEGE